MTSLGDDVRHVNDSQSTIISVPVITIASQSFQMDRHVFCAPLLAHGGRGGGLPPATPL